MQGFEGSSYVQCPTGQEALDRDKEATSSHLLLRGKPPPDPPTRCHRSCPPALRLFVPAGPVPKYKGLGTAHRTNNSSHMIIETRNRRSAVTNMITEQGGQPRCSDIRICSPGSRGPYCKSTFQRGFSFQGIGAHLSSDFNQCHLLFSIQCMTKGDQPCP